MNEENEMQKRLQAPTGQQIFEVTGTAPLTPMNMIERAVSQGAGIDVLERLLALQERWEAGQARKAYDEAISRAKAEIPTIVKNKQVDFVGKTGIRTNYKHETLDEVVRTVQPILARHGLDARFRSNVEGGVITVTCRISHKDGHAEETSLPTTADLSGNKNHIQAVGSAATYLQRYTLKLALGLAAAEDDDGRLGQQAVGNGGGRIDGVDAADISDALAECGADTAAFCRYLKVPTIADIPANRLDDAWAAIKAKQRQANLKKVLEASVAQLDADYAKEKDGE